MDRHPTYALFGGGGFTHGTHPELEDLLLGLHRGGKPAIGYIGAANNDDPDRIERFHDRFRGHARNLSHLPSSANGADASKWLSTLDILYVAGGDTHVLNDYWRLSGLKNDVVNAANRGMIISGVSAGAACWFEYALSASGGKGLKSVKCLGLLRGSCCPHYTSDETRSPEFERRIETRSMPSGIGIGDGAGVVIREGSRPKLYCADRNTCAWSVRRHPESLITTPIQPFENIF